MGIRGVVVTVAALTAVAASAWLLLRPGAGTVPGGRASPAPPASGADPASSPAALPRAPDGPGAPRPSVPPAAPAPPAAGVPHGDAAAETSAGDLSTTGAALDESVCQPDPPNPALAPLAFSLGGRLGGHRNLRALGGSGTEELVERGLHWLQRHQDALGCWDPATFPERCTRPAFPAAHEGDVPICPPTRAGADGAAAAGPPPLAPGREVCDGAGAAGERVTTTALAILALTAYGETHKTPRFGPAVRAGLKYLKSVQRPDGWFLDPAAPGAPAAQAQATLAMADAYGLTQSPLFKGSAQVAADALHGARDAGGAWSRWDLPGTPDPVLTAWVALALRGAAIAGLRVDERALREASVALVDGTDPRTGRFGGDLRPAAAGLPPGVATSAAALARLALGEPASSPDLLRIADLLLSHAPPPRPAAGTGPAEGAPPPDALHRHFATLLLFQVGGARWTAWNDALRGAVDPAVHMDPSDHRRGSVDPLDPWEAAGGRVAATALAMLDLEVYFRYARPE